MTTTIRICLIEDDAIMGESLMDRFKLEGFAPRWCHNGTTAIRTLRDDIFDLVVSDIHLGDMSGEEVFARIQVALPKPPPFVFITGYGTVDQAVELIKRGARDYVTKPFDLDALVQKVRDLVPVDGATGQGDFPLGIAPAMQHIAASLPRIANGGATVLIVGESGVGKERVAQQLHAARTDAAKRPFIAVNCGAITEGLLEAELFGYEKGAYTGATRTKPGVFEQANGGTLFLDEIGEMPPSMQVKLLRVIQDRRVTRVGGETPIPVELLLICATHRDLKKRVAEGSFREDLFYRINVVQIKVPPLRERLEDIQWFADRFLTEIGERTATPRRRLHPATEQAILAYPWPGNVRELHHAIERACIVSAAELLPIQALLVDETVPDSQESLNEYLRACERRYIVSALENKTWHIAQTAELLGISRKNLWEKMRKLEISAPDEA
jgi:DNA-binding NtrC family response regulator